MSDPTNQTECAQIDALIQAKKDEIAALEDLKETFTNDDDQPESKTPAEVAQDPTADSAERAAAANAVLGQDPVKVNAEQSEPSPSTHAEQFEDKSDNKATKENEEAEAKSIEAEGVQSESQDVKLPDGRENVNELGAQGQVEAPGDTSGKETTITKDEAKKDKSSSKKADKKKS